MLAYMSLLCMSKKSGNDKFKPDVSYKRREKGDLVNNMSIICNWTSQICPCRLPGFSFCSSAEISPVSAPSGKLLCITILT